MRQKRIKWLRRRVRALNLKLTRRGWKTVKRSYNRTPKKNRQHFSIVLEG